MRCLLLIIAIFEAVQGPCVRRTTTSTTTTTTTTPTTTTTETIWHMNLQLEFVLWSTYDPQNVTELMNKFPKAAMEKALAPFDGGPIINLTLSNNSGNFEYYFIVPYVKNTSLCYPTKAGSELFDNACAVIEHKDCDGVCYWVKGNSNSTRLRYTRNELTATVTTTSYLFSPNAGSYVSSILRKVKDALKSAEQVTVMPGVDDEDYVKVTITAFGSNSCDQMKVALNSTLSTLPPTIVKTTEYSCSSP